MKTRLELKKQRAILRLSVSIAMLENKITEEEAKGMYERIERAYVNCYFGKRIF